VNVKENGFKLFLYHIWGTAAQVWLRGGLPSRSHTGSAENTIELLRLTGCREDRQLKCQGHKGPNNTPESTTQCSFPLGFTHWSGSPIRQGGVLCGHLESWLLTSFIEARHGSERTAEAECHVPNALWWSQIKPELQEDTKELLFEPHPTQNAMAKYCGQWVWHPGTARNVTLEEGCSGKTSKTFQHLKKHEYAVYVQSNYKPTSNLIPSHNRVSYVCCFSGGRKSESRSPWMWRKEKWTSWATA